MILWTKLIFGAATIAGLVATGVSTVRSPAGEPTAGHTLIGTLIGNTTDDRSSSVSSASGQRSMVWQGPCAWSSIFSGH